MERLVKLLDDFDRDLRPFEEESKFTIWDNHIDLAKYLIDNDVRQLVHGRWMKAECSERDGNARCSVCDQWEWDNCSYCPNCGAKMDLEE